MKVRDWSEQADPSPREMYGPATQGCRRPSTHPEPRPFRSQAETLDRAQSWTDSFFGGSTSSEAIESKIGRSKLILKNLYKRAPGLVVGGAVGGLLGYRLG